MAKKDGAIEIEGTVVESPPERHVPGRSSPNGHKVLAHISGKMRSTTSGSSPTDRVVVELSSVRPDRVAAIVYRYK